MVFLLVFYLIGFAAQSAELKVIDVHTHAEFTNEIESTSKINITEDQYTKELKEAGVVAAVSHSDKDGVEKYRDLKRLNVLQCVAVTSKINVKKIEDGIKNKKFGCIKIYLGYIYRFAYDKLHNPIYRIAQKYDVPVVFHTGDTYSSKALLKYADPLTIDEVAVKYPKVKFVIAHLGNPWIRSAAEVAYKNDNVYVEASGMIIGDIKSLPKEIIEQQMEREIRWAFNYIDNPEKFMFGSDWPLVNIKDYLEAYKKAIPEKHWQNVFYSNAVKVFKINDPTSSK